MTARDPPWELCRSFLAVVRDGSLSAAARALGLTQPTLGRHIAALEQMLGLALFTRSPGGLLPTAAARGLLVHAEAMEAAAHALRRAATGEAQAAGGTVRLTASTVMGAEVLPPMLAEFQARHPGIVLELALSDQQVDLSRRDADLAVRMVRPRQQTLSARLLGRATVGLHASRDYLDRNGTPRTIDDLAGHRLIGFDRDPQAARLVAASGVAVTRESFAFRCDSDLAQLAALRAGAGIGACQVGIAARDTALVRVLPALVRVDLEVWLAMHADLRAVRPVRLLFDHLAERLGTYLRIE